MNRKYTVMIFVLAGLSIVLGCATTQELTTSVKDTVTSTKDKVTSTVSSTVSSITSTVDPAVVNKIPADQRDGFAKAEYDLKVASEKLKLAELKSEQAAAQERYLNYEESLAANFRNEAEIDYDNVKMDAIIKAGLGKSQEDNNKIKAALQSRKMKVQADRINIQSAIVTSKSKVEELSAQITKMDETIKTMKFDEKN